MTNRIQKVVSVLKEKELDAVLITKPENMYYLVGYTGSAAFLFVTQKDIIILTDVRYTQQVKQECPHIKHVEYSREMPHFMLVKNMGFQRIGYEGNYLSYGAACGFQGLMSWMEWVNVGSLIEQFRAVKDENELELLRKAAKISDKSFMETLNVMKAGMREKDVAEYLFSQMVKNGADHHLSFDIIVGSGYRGANSHSIASEKTIEEGDFVVIDFGCRYKHYTTDTTRTVVIGQPTEKHEEIYHHVQKAQELALSQVKVGMTNAEAHRITTNYMKEHGYGEVSGNTLGHGIGLETEDAPLLIDMPEFFGETVLEENMVVTIEPGIYIPEYGGVRIEDDVIIKKEKGEIITQIPRELISIF